MPKFERLIQALRADFQKKRPEATGGVEKIGPFDFLLKRFTLDDQVFFA